MSLSAATAAPAPVTLAGKHYSASPLSLFELGELEEHARAAVLAVACKGLAGLPPDQRDALYDRALARALTLTFDSPEMSRFLYSRAGMFAIVSASLRPRHPEMDPTTVARLFTDHRGELAPIVRTIMRLSGMDEDEKPTGGTKSGEGEKGEEGV
jgi:hypothetical protein